MSAPYRPFGLDAQQERKVKNNLDSRHHGSSHMVCLAGRSTIFPHGLFRASIP